MHFSDPLHLLSVAARGLKSAFPAFGSPEKLANAFGFPLEASGNRVSNWWPRTERPAAASSLSATPAALRSFADSLASFSRISHVAPSALRFHPVDHRIQISRQPSALGKFISVGRGEDVDGGEVRVSFGEGADEVHRDVFSQVLNGSQLVDFLNLAHGDVDGYYLVKNPIWRSSKDVVQLRRLERTVNLTMHESQTDSSKILDVRLHLPGVAINVRYEL